MAPARAAAAAGPPRWPRGCGSLPPPFQQREQALQATAGLRPQLLGLDHLDAVADRPVHEALAVDDRHAQGHAAVRALLAVGLGAAQLRQARRRTAGWMRERRKERSAPRPLSCPATYQVPRRWTRAYGSTCRSDGERPGGR